MTALIRQSTETVRPVAWKPGEVSPTPPPRDPLIVSLEQEVADLTAALKRAQAKLDETAKEARAEGLKEAEAGFARDEERRLSLLQSAIETATVEVKTKAAQLDALALLLCETVLETAFDRSTDFRDLLSRAIAKQLSGLRREMVIAVHVNSLDFPDETALQRLQEKLAASSVAINRDQSLDAGECRIDLRLGHIEIALPRYWKELKAKLLSAASEASP